MLAARPGQGVPRIALIASLAAARISLAFAAAASAATYTVDNTGDGDTQGTCEAQTAGCTLRGAILAANATAATPTMIAFSASFDGEAAPRSRSPPPRRCPRSPRRRRSTAAVARFRATRCRACPSKASPASRTLAVKANGSAVERLKFDKRLGRAPVAGAGRRGPRVEVLENTFTGNQNAISSTGTIGGTGNLIAGNTIQVPADFNFGITLRNGPNRIFGNVIEGGGCCYTGIWMDEVPAGTGVTSGNVIGGDTEDSENLITGFANGAIRMDLAASTRNEVGRNRGENGSSFIYAPNAIGPPAIGSALQSSLSGTAEPDSVVRVFRMASEFDGGIAGFLGEAVADSSGNWKASFAAVPAGTFVAATQTLEGGTSALSAVTAAQADPPAPPSGCPAVPSQCPPTPPPPAPDTTKPKLTIKKAPKAKSTATTAKFVFGSDKSGSTFMCKLDKKAFANCKSPKTYKKLVPGKHVFKVKATDSAGNVSAVVTRKFTVLE